MELAASPERKSNSAFAAPAAESETIRLMSPTRIELSEEVAFRELSGQGVLLDLATGMYFGLNEVGTRLWTLLAEDDSLEKATAALQCEFDVVPEVLQADVNQLLREMQGKGLVQIVENDGR